MECEVISPFSCKIDLWYHSRIQSEQIELFVFQLFSELSKTFEQIAPTVADVTSELARCELEAEQMAPCFAMLLLLIPTRYLRAAITE